MQHFSIKDIENLCGIKAHTIRAWEQRYKLCVPKRKDSLHRTYDNDDLRELLRVSFLYHNGHKISKIAGLSQADIEKLVEESYISNTNNETFIHQLVEAGLDFDKERFEKVINCLVLRIGIENCIKDIFYPFLHRIGLLWMTNHAIPAQEHFTSHIIRKKIIVATDGLEMSTSNKTKVLVFTPAGEYHEIPLLTANYFFRKHGNQTVYFGVNVALESLKYYLQYHSPQYLYAHIITYLNNSDLEDYISSLCGSFGGKVVLSGLASKKIERKFSNLKIIDSLDEMISFSKEIAST